MRNKWIAAPYVGWMAFFVVAPLIVVLIYAFTRESADGSWFITLDNFEGMMGYASVFGRSFLLAGIATLVCILLGYPMAYFLARERGRLRSMATLLIMLPMWMNFLLRTYSWVFLLERNGFFNSLLSAIGLPKLDIINTSGAVVLPALHGAAHLLGHCEDRLSGHRGGPGPGCQQRAGVPAGDLPAVSAGCSLRRDHGADPLGVHLRHLPPAGRRQEPVAGRSH